MYRLKQSHEEIIFTQTADMFAEIVSVTFNLMYLGWIIFLCGFPTYGDLLAGRVPVGEGHHDVEGGQGEHQVEQGPGVLDAVPLGVAAGAVIRVLARLGVRQVDGVGHRDPGGRVVGGGPHAGVEDAAEPHDQPDDARGVHGRGLLGLVLHPDLGGHVLDAEHLGGQVELAVGVGLVGHGGPGEVHHVQGHEAGLQQARARQVLLDLR